jgi:hypothetical protein
MPLIVFDLKWLEGVGVLTGQSGTFGELLELLSKADLFHECSILDHFGRLEGVILFVQGFVLIDDLHISWSGGHGVRVIRSWSCVLLLLLDLANFHYNLHRCRWSFSLVSCLSIILGLRRRSLLDLNGLFFPCRSD